MRGGRGRASFRGLPQLTRPGATAYRPPTPRWVENDLNENNGVRPIIDLARPRGCGAARRPHRRHVPWIGLRTRQRA